MSDAYDLEGNPISIEKWSQLRGSSERILKQTNIGAYLVSTVWVGLDMRYNEGAPLIFETMVFKEDDWNDLYCDRYSTREEALAGHEKAVALAGGGQLELHND